MSPPIDRVIAALEARGLTVRGSEARGWQVQCPVHDDQQPSLSIKLGDDGKVLLHCFAGCSTEDIVGALGLEVADLFPAREEKSSARPSARQASKAKVVAAYDYVDEAGNLLYQVLRRDDKAFPQRRPNGSGGWIYDLDGTRRVPYHLPQLVAAVEAGAVVYVVEGEKDADALVRLGLVATCNPGGAGKWRPEFAEYFRAAKVAIIADKDKPGRSHALDIARSLEGVAAKVRIGEAAEGKDVSDHLAAGLGLDKLVPVTIEDLEASVNAHASAADHHAGPTTSGQEEARTPRSSDGRGGVAYPEPMRPEAFHGLAGEVVRVFEPHSEADPVALLMHFLLAFGNAIGRGPGLLIEGDFHATNEFAVLVGDSAKGRKGTARGRMVQLFKHVDPEWATDHQGSGLVSGEALIWEVRDPIIRRRQPKTKDERTRAAEDGLIEELEDAGIEDKRLMVTEGEFAKVLAVTRREGNTLSMVVRDFWDQSTVRTMAKNSPARATGALVSVIGHITTDELRRELTDTAKANGFANRFMFVCVRRSKALPFGGRLDEDVLESLAHRVGVALAHARDFAGSLAWGDGPALWERVYAELSAGRPGMFGAVTARAETHVLKVAVLYALLDGKRAIGREHIEAGLAVWDYAERSAGYIFCGLTGDPLADQLLDAIRGAGDAGIDRGELRLSVVSHTVKTERFDAALSYLERCLLAEPVTVKTGGRPAERWYLKTGSKPDFRDESQVSSPEQGFHPPSGDAQMGGDRSPADEFEAAKRRKEARDGR